MRTNVSWSEMYELWIGQAQGILNLVVIGYNVTKKPKTTTKKELKRNNKIAMDFILEGLL
jgi:hypothetical protein